jgi:hypothetical protein
VEITWTIGVRTAVENWLSVRAALPSESARSASGFVTEVAGNLEVEDVAKNAGHLLFLWVLHCSGALIFVTVIATHRARGGIAKRRRSIVTCSLNDFVQLATVKPHTPAIWAVINLNSLTICHNEGGGATWTLHDLPLLFGVTMEN